MSRDVREVHHLEQLHVQGDWMVEWTHCRGEEKAYLHSLLVRRRSSEDMQETIAGIIILVNVFVLIMISLPAAAIRRQAKAVVSRVNSNIKLTLDKSKSNARAVVNTVNNKIKFNIKKSFSNSAKGGEREKEVASRFIFIRPASFYRNNEVVVGSYCIVF
jgi:hypothetical protein